MYIEEQIQAILTRIEELEKRQPAQPEEWLTIAETARRLGVSYSVISDRVQDGRIKSTRMAGHPRIPMSQFLEDAEGVKVIQPQPQNERQKNTQPVQKGSRKSSEPEWAESVRKAVFG